MLSFLKKLPEKNAADLVPAWHCNFRNYEVLPDTKIVRTSFYANCAAVLIALAVIVAFIYQEYRLYFLRGEVADWQQKIDATRPGSERAVATYKKFQAEEKKINDLQAYKNGQKVVFSDLLIHLSETLPTGVGLTNIEYRESGVSVRGYIEGTPEQASGVASAYEKLLKDDAQFSRIFATVSLTNVSRDSQTNRLNFELVLSFATSKTTKERK